MVKEIPKPCIPLARRRACALGKASPPHWMCLDPVVAMWSDSPQLRADPNQEFEGGLYFELENTDHPEQVPLLALRQVDCGGRNQPRRWWGVMAHRIALGRS